MMNAKLTSILGTVTISSLFAFGCASVPAPKELVDARASYQRAEASPGAALTPVPLHNARMSLDDAEKAFNDDATSNGTIATAYVADRKAQLAEAEGLVALAAQRAEQAKAALANYNAQDLANTKQGLAAAQGELGATRTALGITADQLAVEKKAREAAEKRAKEAMDKLALAAQVTVKEETRGTVILLPGGVLFVTNKADLLPTAQAKLSAVADALKEAGDRKITVEGHTDSQGNEASNLVLGTKRAESVRDYLASHGVKKENITATGIGQGRPVADNKSPEGRADNRRVEIVVAPAPEAR